jgi:hypothetical protein
MGVLHGIADLRDQFQTLPRVERLRVRVFGQRLATNELHGEEGDRRGSGRGIGRGAARFVDVCDPGMLQLSRRLRLALEAARQVRRRT